jgi:hypothetical protein
MTTRLPKIRFGGIAANRSDEIGGSSTGITTFRILPQTIKWWGGK